MQSIVGGNGSGSHLNNSLLERHGVCDLYSGKLECGWKS